jgi:predicted Zn-dependent protease
VYVVESDMVNAIAAPGGHIVVYRGLMKRTRSPEELAAVLSHEVTHVLERHGTRAMMRSLTFWALVSFLAGDVNGTIVSLVGAIEEMRFSREQEERADRGAMALLERLRVEPRAMVEVYRTLEKAGGEMPKLARYLSTHPPIENRIAVIREWEGRSRYAPVRIVEVAQWPPVGACLMK